MEFSTKLFGNSLFWVVFLEVFFKFNFSHFWICWKKITKFVECILPKNPFIHPKLETNCAEIDTANKCFKLNAKSTTMHRMQNEPESYNWK